MQDTVVEPNVGWIAWSPAEREDHRRQELSGTEELSVYVQKKHTV